MNSFQKSKIIAHTSDRGEFEKLFGKEGHLYKTCKFLNKFTKFKKFSKIVGYLHDIGKSTPEWQDYIMKSYNKQWNSEKRIDHKSAGFKYVVENTSSKMENFYRGVYYYLFLGHHGGLFDGDIMTTTNSLDNVNCDFNDIDIKIDSSEIHNFIFDVYFKIDSLYNNDKKRKMMYMALFIKMLHSSLVDSDYLATESFTNPEKFKQRTRKSVSFLKVYKDVEKYIKKLQNNNFDFMNSLRNEIHKKCVDSARALSKQNNNLLYLEVPTGCGKTLSSLSFALKYASSKKLNRIIYVIPYTSIIDQTVNVFSNIKLLKDNMIVHHSNIDENTRENNKFDCENWDSPFVLTTFVQFFESIFSCKNSKLRKIHNIANSVVVIDEIQSIPSKLYKSCYMAMEFLSLAYNTTFVLCSATQPKIPNEVINRNLFKPILDRKYVDKLFLSTKRVKTSFIGYKSNEEIFNHYKNFSLSESSEVNGNGATSCMVICSTTQHAQDMYDTFKKEFDYVYHLSTLMCMKHRVRVLNEVISRLNSGLPVILITTKIVEAGVDISFPIVYRDKCGLDSIIQAAGRCNRNKEYNSGFCYVFCSDMEDYNIFSMYDIRVGWNITRRMIKNSEDIFLEDKDFISSYYDKFFSDPSINNSSSLDSVIMSCLGDKSSIGIFEFQTCSDTFNLINDDKISVIVPYDSQCIELVNQLNEGNNNINIIRKLQPYVVSLYNNRIEDIKDSLIELDNGLIYLTSLEGFYDENKGIVSIKNEEISK